MERKRPYYFDYPSRPIGHGNPYYCCESCGISAPQINGRLNGHGRYCEWRRKQVEDYLQRRQDRKALAGSIKKE